MPFFGGGGGGGGAAGGGLLARTAYLPGAKAIKSNNTTSFTDVDASLAVTFTVPDSGEVFVRLSASAGSAADTTETQWNLREGASDVPNTGVKAGVGPNMEGVTRVLHLSGLTPGASKTYKWGFKTEVGASHVYLGVGADHGVAVMEVYDAAAA